MGLWFRSWHGAPTDNKWLVIARRAAVLPGVVSAVAWALMDHASQADDRGSIAGFDIETYAMFSGFDESDIVRVIEAMKDKGIIALDERLANWEKCQPAEGLRPSAEVWIKIRGFVFERDDYTCQYCGRRGVKLDARSEVHQHFGGW